MRKSHACALAIASVALSSTLSFARTGAIPDTRPGRLFAQYLELCSKASQDNFRTWGQGVLSDQFLQRFSADLFAARETAKCRANGGFKLVSLGFSTEDTITAKLQAVRTGLHTDFRLSSGPDGKLRGLGSRPSAPPEETLTKDLSDENVTALVRKLTTELSASGQFSGIVMAARGSAPFLTVTAGQADREKGTRITPRTKFTLGSMSKMWTAVGLGQMLDQGRISFDDPVGKFFPDFANKTVREKVTVGMLLSHTSGMGDFLSKRTPEMMKSGVKRASEFVPLFVTDEPQFEPGSRWEYSNAGLALAGAILEKVSGIDYPDYVRTFILAPAGMTNSDPNNIPSATTNLVTPYTRPDDPDSEEEWIKAPADIGSPAGGAVSTAEDLLKFADALRSGKLVSKSTFEMMSSGKAKRGDGGDYGYAMYVSDVYGKKVVGHGGGFPGVNTQLYLILDSPFNAVVLANVDPPAADAVGETTKALLAAKAKAGK